MKYLRRFFPLVGLALSLQCVQAETILVRTAAQDSQPKFVMKGDAIGGLCVDVFRAMERVDPELQFSPMHQFMPLARIEHLLESGDIDTFCGLAKTAERQAMFEFVDIPIYLTHSVLAVRREDNVAIKSFDDLRKLGDDGPVLVVAKSVHAQVLAAQPGIKYYDTATNTSENFRLLLLGRGRFIFHSDFALMDEIKRDQVGDQIKLLPVKFLTEGRYLVISKKATPVLREKLRRGIEQLQASGRLNSIYKSYELR